MEFKYRQQVAVYKSLRKIDTSYKNSSTLRFDNTLRMFVNRLRKMESFDGKQLLSVFCLWHILALSDTRKLKPSTFIQEFVINHWHALKKRLSQSRIWNGLYISPVQMRTVFYWTNTVNPIDWLAASLSSSYRAHFKREFFAWCVPIKVSYLKLFIWFIN